jgi:hypothetical protein
MLSTPEVKQAFMDAAANGLLIDERGNERENYDVTQRFGQAPLIDVVEWIAEYKAEQAEQEAQQQEGEQQ